MDQGRKALIRALNDRLRQTGLGGMIIQTSGIQLLGEEVRRRVVRGVMEFDGFTPANDPNGEHNFGWITVERRIYLWKIDYFEGDDLLTPSPDPADDKVTTRVLTILLAEEY